MTASLLALATHAPGRAQTQDESLDVVVRATNASPRRARALATLHERSGVEQRHTALRAQHALYNADEQPTTAERLTAANDAAEALALPVCARALRDAGRAPEQITHLVTVSCTALAAPGVDRAIIDALALNPTVERTNVGFMGCHGAINGLRVARAIADADHDATVLLCCVEVCSAHLQVGSQPGAAAANALFADGAAACLIGHGRGPVLHATGATILPDSRHAMQWIVGDHGFEMTLTPDVPEWLREHVGPWINDWLESNGHTPADINAWAIHPGGPRILDAVAESIGLGPDNLDASRHILRTRGNMSSPTLLFVLEEQLRQHSPPAVLLAFGPGLCGEALLLTSDGPTTD